MLIDCHNHIGADMRFYQHGDFPYAQQLVDLTGRGGALGVTHWIVFPFVSYAKDGVPYALENRLLLQECHDLFPEEGRKTLPFVMVDPLRETDAQAAELVKLRDEFRFHGIKIQSTIIQADIKRLAQEGRVFLDLAREWDVPFLIHSSVIESDLWAQARDILDLAEANPDIRFCVAHSCRFDKECLDRVNVLPNTWFDNSAHCIHCEGAAADKAFVAPKGRRFDSDYNDPARVIADLAAAYPDKFMWGSDSPFYSYAAAIDREVVRLISTYENEVAALKASPADVVGRIAASNTLNYLKLPDESILS